MAKSKGKVLVAMSGGVDSSVTALLLKNEGYDVTGITMVLFDCENNTSVKDAEKVSKQLKIQHFVYDLKKEFKENVIDYFINTYILGSTPNPCVRCNKTIKFGSLYNKGMDLGYDYVATGHYTRKILKNGQYYLKSSKDKFKDQTYFLYNLNQSILKNVLFPVGEYMKKDIRKIAQENNLVVAQKSESQDICFVQNIKYSKYILMNSNYKNHEGEIVDKDGKVIGKHNGLLNYTIGQRKGIKLSNSLPYYVLDMDTQSNLLIVGLKGDLQKRTVLVEEVNFINSKYNENVEAQIRYKSIKSKAKISYLKDNKLEVIFDVPQRAITKGQSIVFWNGEYMIGGGIITDFD